MFGAILKSFPAVPYCSISCMVIIFYAFPLWLLHNWYGGAVCFLVGVIQGRMPYFTELAA